MESMNKSEKVKVFAKLHELVNYYYEYRDQPIKGDFDFFAEVEKCCKTLDLDFDDFNKEYKLK
jgi:hypothetical protein